MLATPNNLSEQDIEEISHLDLVTSREVVFIVVGASTEDGQKAIKDYSVKKTPAYLFIGAGDKLLKKHEGKLGPKAIRKLMVEVTSKV